MMGLEIQVDAAAAAHGFSGVVRIDRDGEIELAKSYGFAQRAYEIVNTQFAIASGTKGLTALTIVSLIEGDTLELATTARSVLGRDLALIRDDVTIEDLLAHRSGIGDYLDEDAAHEVIDYVMAVPVHQLATTEQYLAVLDGHRTQFPLGEQFSYNNGAYVVLALIAERKSGLAFHELVHQRVCIPARLDSTEFLRSDQLPARAATGYLTSDCSSGDERSPPPRSGKRRWWNLFHRCRYLFALDRHVRGPNRFEGLGGGNDSIALRLGVRCATGWDSGSGQRATS